MTECGFAGFTVEAEVQGCAKRVPEPVKSKPWAHHALGRKIADQTPQIALQAIQRVSRATFIDDDMVARALHRSEL